jgi:hypothetical protein
MLAQGTLPHCFKPNAAWVYRLSLYGPASGHLHDLACDQLESAASLHARMNRLVERGRMMNRRRL